jgi:hypothetical protein
MGVRRDPSNVTRNVDGLAEFPAMNWIFVAYFG